MNHQYQYTVEKLKKVKAVEMSEEKGIWGKRFFPSNYMRGFDPFVLMDEIFVEPPGGLPTQINEGIESITYVIDGSIDFKDPEGNVKNISEGGVNAFSSGKGVQHSFKPVRNGVNHLIRLWIKMPADLKGSSPSYQLLEGKDIPYEESTTKLIRKVAGKKSPVSIHGKIQVKDVTLTKGAIHKFNFSDKDRGFFYVLTGINGSIRINDNVIDPGEGIFFENTSELLVSCRDRNCRFIFVSGIPNGEPIKLKGGIVEW